MTELNLKTQSINDEVKESLIIENFRVCAFLSGKEKAMLKEEMSVEEIDNWLFLFVGIYEGKNRENIADDA